MQIDLKKQSHVLFFIVFLPALSLGIGWLSSKLIQNPPFWVETISPLAAYAILFALFDKIVWHWPIFKWLGIVACPDVRGRWLGEQVSSVKGANGKHITSRVIMEVSQTFSGLHVEMFYHKWHSSISAAQFLLIQNTPTLITMFEAQPKADYDGDGVVHKGVARLTACPDGTLTGTYFNSSGNEGELNFRRTGYELCGSFVRPDNQK
jgi:hypothetical protein